MKKTRKAVFTLIAIAIIASMPMISASAIYEESAQRLFELGLFRGTGEGFDLGRAPTRAEAVTMLVRLLGLEKDADGGNYSHPFTDVPDWASPNVALAYEMGYTIGVSATLFDPHDLCSAQMYVTFILRALGYTDDDAVGATLWGEAIEFGKSVGVIDDILLTGQFLRGNMAAVSYLALSTAPTGGESDTLLERLVADGAVDGDVAAQTLAQFRLFGEVGRIGSEFEKLTSFAMTRTVSSSMSQFGHTITTNSIMDFAVLDDGTIAINMGTHANDEKEVMEVYFVGDFVYMNENGNKYKVPLDLLPAFDVYALPGLSAISEITALVLYMGGYITKGTQDGLTVYTFEFSQDANGIDAGDSLSAPDADFDAQENTTMRSFELRFFVGEDGGLVKYGMYSDMQAAADVVSMSMAMEYEVTATGSEVYFELPDDLDTYLDYDDTMDLDVFQLGNPQTIAL